jgi:hypothetical protein
MTPEFGTDPHKIIRKGAPDTSIVAGYTVDTKTDERKAYGFYRRAGAHGLTSKELAKKMQKPLNAISGRITALRDKNLLKDSGVRRDKCRVMIVVDEQMEMF